MTKKFGIISYNIYCNFTNYGSALQSWALYQTINKLGNGKWQAVLIDYCPDVLKDKNPMNPMGHMWDSDATSHAMCELSLPAIRENYRKFDNFYHEKFYKSVKQYTSSNFDEVVADEKIDGFVCGSDTIFCIDEFKGFDDGYYANYPCMKNGYSVAYAASFGDAHFMQADLEILNKRLQNFKAIGLRESSMVDYVREHTQVPLKRVLDPTLLLNSADYEALVTPRQEKEKYLLLYARRYDAQMEAFAETLAAEKGWKIIEISLRATNGKKHRMFYEAGVEEFLSLVKYAEYVVTNSFHGLIFSVQYRRQFSVFSREQCDVKITELLELIGVEKRLISNETGEIDSIDYEDVHHRIAQERTQSLAFLEEELLHCH